MTNQKNDFYVSEKTITALARILQLEESEVKNNKHLFYRIDPYTARSLEYLAEISSQELKLSANLSLNYLLKYNESAFEIENT